MFLQELGWNPWHAETSEAGSALERVRRAAISGVIARRKPFCPGLETGPDAAGLALRTARLASRPERGIERQSRTGHWIPLRGERIRGGLVLSSAPATKTTNQHGGKAAGRGPGLLASAGRTSPLDGAPDRGGSGETQAGANRTRKCADFVAEP